MLDNGLDWENVKGTTIEAAIESMFELIEQKLSIALIRPIP
ncbi:MAG: hypothetical protein R3C97_16965 [Geminicoccaceae bacterium]